MIILILILIRVVSYGIFGDSDGYGFSVDLIKPEPVRGGMFDDGDGNIISLLRDIGCEIDQNVNSFGKDWNELLFIHVIVKCLENIDGVTGKESLSEMASDIATKKLDHNVKIGKQIVVTLKELGYDENIGYYNIIHPDEKSTRSILQFLVSKLYE